MPTLRFRSRIHQNFSPEALADLNRICIDRTIGNNNLKADMFIDVLNKHKIDYSELGPGTNRMAILIDNYVYKIAFDHQGKRDNINEFKLSKELQPFVVKTYETNDLISVHEYVTVISREEFIERVDEIRKILAVLAETYLLGDVGAVAKNFLNWGYRDDGKLVILDYAHIYRVNPEQIVCRNDQTILDYDINFHEMVCPKCAKKYRFEEVRRLIPFEQEQQENIIARELAYKLTSEVEEFTVETTRSSYIGSNKDELPSRYNINSNNEPEKEEKDMSREDRFGYDPEEQEESYDKTLELLRQLKNTGGKEVVVKREEERVVYDGNTTIKTSVSETEFNKDGDRSQVKVYRQTAQVTAPVIEEKEEEVVDEIDEEEIHDRAIEELKTQTSPPVQEVQEKAEPVVESIETQGTQEAVNTETTDPQTENVGDSVEQTEEVTVSDKEVVEEEKEEVPMVTVTKTEEKVVVDNEVVHEESKVEVEVTGSDDEDEAEKLRRELEKSFDSMLDEQSATSEDSFDDFEDEFEELHEAADREKYNYKNRGGKGKWV